MFRAIAPRFYTAHPAMHHLSTTPFDAALQSGANKAKPKPRPLGDG